MIPAADQSSNEAAVNIAPMIIVAGQMEEAKIEQDIRFPPESDDGS